MWRLLIITFFYLPISSEGQITFNQRFNFGYPAAVLTSIVPTDSCYYVTGMIADSITPHLPGNIFLKFDLEGNPIMWKTLISPGKTLEFWNNTLYPLADGNFIVSGDSQDFSGTNIKVAVIIKYNPNGDTIFMKEYFNPLFPDFNRTHNKYFRLASDKGFILANWIRTGDDPPNTDIHIIKTDSLGIIEWEKTYGGVFWDVPMSLLIKENGKIIVGAINTNLNLVNENYNNRTYIFQLDSLGNHEWSWLSHPLWGLRDGARDMVLLDDGSIVVASGRGYEQERSSKNVVWYEKLIYKLDADKELVWEREFKDNRLSDLTRMSKIVEVKDGSGFVGIGTSAKPNSTVNSWGTLGWIGKISPDGDSLWARTYQFLTTDIFVHEVYDLKQTPDDGFIICGEAKDNTADTLFQQAWLLKLDEHGCLVPGCHILDAVEEAEIPRITLSIYPNPTSDYLNIWFHSPRPPKDASFRIVDVQGRLLREFKNELPEVTLILPVWDYAPGVYFLQYLEGGRVLRSEKFVVSR